MTGTDLWKKKIVYYNPCTYETVKLCNENVTFVDRVKVEQCICLSTTWTMALPCSGCCNILYTYQRLYINYCWAFNIGLGNWVIEPCALILRHKLHMCIKIYFLGSNMKYYKLIKTSDFNNVPIGKSTKCTSLYEHLRLSWNLEITYTINNSVFVLHMYMLP